MFSGLLTADG
jgi:alpha-tubulin suppressor-like RCC1 family protein